MLSCVRAGRPVPTRRCKKQGDVAPPTLESPFSPAPVVMFLPRPALPLYCSEFMAQQSNVQFWSFVDEVHKSLDVHLEAGATYAPQTEASEWSTDIVEMLVSPSMYKVWTYPFAGFGFCQTCACFCRWCGCSYSRS